MHRIYDNKGRQNRDFARASKHFDECLVAVTNQRLCTGRQILFLNACTKRNGNQNTGTEYMQA